MILLALTTSTDQGSLALIKDKKIIGKQSWNKAKQHSEVLTIHIQKLLQKAKVKPQDLTAIAVDRGPGSFTGCRMAVNVARTMAYTLNIPLFAADSLEIMAFGKRQHKGKIVTVLNAHKSLLYFNWYESDGQKIIDQGSSIQAVSPKKVLEEMGGKTLVSGEVPSEMKELKAKPRVPEAMDLALMALEEKYQKHFQKWMEVEPRYIRVPDVVERMQLSDN
jgi:tRNA threonylcarbamoyladenosine biosynthesis protein TsaB